MPGSPEVRTEIRTAAAADLPELTRIYNHYVRHTAITFDTEVFTVDGRRAWFDQFSPQGRHQLLTLTVNGVPAGYASSSRFRTKTAYDTSVETSIYLDPEQRGAGHGLRLYAALFERISDAQVHRCFAGVALPNEPSLALHRAFGFKDVGTMREAGYKHGQFHDVHWLQRDM